jgi:hypothetical protein
MILAIRMQLTLGSLIFDVFLWVCLKGISFHLILFETCKTIQESTCDFFMELMCKNRTHEKQ